MTFRDLLSAAWRLALVLPLLAAAAFGLLAGATALADHATIGRAIRAAPPVELGVPAIDQYRRGFREGFFPECAGLSLLLREDEAAPLASVIRSETILPPPDTTICRELLRAFADEGAVTWFTYARYWHGSLLLHRAVLSFGGYAALQAIAAGLVAGGLVLLFAALARRVGVVAAGLAVGTFALLGDAVAVGAVPMQAVSVTALAGAAAAFAQGGAGRGNAGVLVAAGLAGAAYNFFDFFCNPDVLAALCAWIFAAVRLKRGAAVRPFDIALVFGAVIAGYGAFWALKWGLALGYAAGGGEVYLFSAGDAERWGPQGGGWLPGRASAAIVAATFDAWWKGGLAVVLAGIAWLAVRHAGWRASAGATFALLLIPALLGFAGVEALAGHTLAHTALTFRLVPLAIGLGLASLVLAAQITPLSRKAAISPAE
ncbi:MAG: hypothetical protein IT548_09360 [Alphaproteobacteria bacterium]|nr:hypothetical protein [Alphaproteobacteria bacterium]